MEFTRVSSLQLNLTVDFNLLVVFRAISIPLLTSVEWGQPPACVTGGKLSADRRARTASTLVLEVISRAAQRTETE